VWILPQKILTWLLVVQVSLYQQQAQKAQAEAAQAAAAAVRSKAEAEAKRKEGKCFAVLSCGVKVVVCAFCRQWRDWSRVCFVEAVVIGVACFV
jgi:hypothetical protein